MYADYLHKANATWPLKTDDFLPYADEPWAYWSGYFTSKPNFKVWFCNTGWSVVNLVHMKTLQILHTCAYLQFLGVCKETEQFITSVQASGGTSQQTH